MAVEKSSAEISSPRNQYLAAFVMNMMSMLYGMELGWVSPSLPILSGKDTPLDKPLTISETSLVGSILCIGGLVGVSFYGWLSDKYGRKIAALISAVPFAFSWILKLSWQTSTGLIFARFAAGFGGAGPFLLTPTYCVEIASLETRGLLGSLMPLAINSGIVLMYILGAYIPYKVVIIIMIILPLIYMFFMMRMPETPLFLVKNKRDEEAAKSIAWLRSESVQSQVVEDILSSLKYDVELANNKSKCVDTTEGPIVHKISASDDVDLATEDVSAWKFFFTSAPTLKAFLVCFSLLTVQCYTGMFALITYANDIFAQAGTSLSPYEGSIIIGFLQLTGSVIASFLIERTGRKVLLISSCGVLAISMITMGTYTYVRALDYDVSQLGWIPVTALSLCVCSFAMGLAPIPYLLPSEIIMVQGRSIATSIMYAWVWTSSFVVAQFFNYAVQLFGLHVVFWTFGIVGIAGIFITIFFLPETKGKLYENILAYYGHGTAVKLSKDGESGELL